jgi:flagellar hook-associated protein 3 FlgL
MGVWGNIYNNTRVALRTHALRLTELQEQAASGARINRASDDPADAYQIIRLRAQSESLRLYGDNLQEVIRTLDLTYTVVQQISDELRSVLEKLEQSVSGTYNQDSRTILGENIDVVVEQVVSLVNTSNLGQFLFSGARMGAQSYVSETDGRYITSVGYQGSMDNLPVPVAPEVEVPGTVVGEKFFRANDRGAPEFLGNTGARGGRGTSSVRGNLYLELTHKETNVVSDPDGVNLQMSPNPDLTDTILGRHDLIVDTTLNTIQFAGGPVTTFTGTETGLAVHNADGDVVYVDVSNLNPLPGPATVTIQADGYLSLDDDAPAVELTDFTDDNVAVLDSDGRVLYVNATGIERTGLEAVRVPGTSDIFDTLIHAGQVLRNDRGLSDSEQRELLRDCSVDMREVIARVTQGMTSLGARLEALDTLGTSLENIRASADDQAGELENADIAQVATDLARTQTLYEMTLATTARLMALSLLDYI